jgi:hypothetical protein
MSSSTLQGKTVRELQELARAAPIDSRPHRRKSLSRAARLHLIDMLSRWSGSGLALIAGAGIYMALTAGRTEPARAAAWTIMLIGALWTCRRLRNEFRSGGVVSARPFRWRASYTSCLCVLGVVLASAPILLSPAGAPPSLLLQIAGITVVAGLGASLVHTAHFASAAAISAPVSAFAVLAGIRSGDPMLVGAGAAAAALATTLIFAANRIISIGAAQRYPRTSLHRREAPGRSSREDAAMAGSSARAV